MRTALLVILALCALTAGATAQTISLDVEWVIPTEKIDGTPLDDLDGFLVCADTQPIPDTSVVGCGLAERFTIIDETANYFGVDWSVLSYSGTVYIRMKAFNTAGVESPWSTEISAPFAVTSLPPIGGESGPMAPVIKWR